MCTPYSVLFTRVTRYSIKTYDCIAFDRIIIGRSIVGIDDFFASNRLNDEGMKKKYFSHVLTVIAIIISNPIQ